MHLVITETSKLVSSHTRAFRTVAISFYVSAIYLQFFSGDLFNGLVFRTPDHAITWVAKVARHR